jgi:hypothetical protein
MPWPTLTAHVDTMRRAFRDNAIAPVQASSSTCRVPVAAYCDSDDGAVGWARPITV